MEGIREREREIKRKFENFSVEEREKITYTLRLFFVRFFFLFPAAAPASLKSLLPDFGFSSDGAFSAAADIFFFGWFLLFFGVPFLGLLKRENLKEVCLLRKLRKD